MARNGTARHAPSLIDEVEASIAAARGIPDIPAPGAGSSGVGERLRQLAFTTAPPSILLVRAVVGAVFLLEGTLKFVDPQGFGAARFMKIGIPFAAFMAPFDGVFEIACGLGLAAGLLTRLSAVPMIVNMLVAIASTKVPLLVHEGFFKAAHEARLDFTMLFGCVFMLLAGGGPLSLDALLLARPRRGPSCDWTPPEE